jgi:enamine deaminase RidA (YjgF/YER057c/UK114 family)
MEQEHSNLEASKDHIHNVNQFEINHILQLSDNGRFNERIDEIKQSFSKQEIFSDNQNESLNKNTNIQIQLLTEDEFEKIDIEYLKTHAFRVTKFSHTYSPNTENRGYMYSQVSIPALDGISYAVFLSKEPIVYERKEQYEISKSGQMTLMRICTSENNGDDLQRAATDSYKQIFDYVEENNKLSKSNKLNLLRVWNYIPNILTDETGTFVADEKGNSIGNITRERYRMFNAGRWDAWQKWGPKLKNGDPIRPAMTGIGSFDGPLVIEALITENDVIAIENPLQTQFIHYNKEKYGAKPPVSARGTIHLTENGPEVYVAGTASLVSDSVAHVGNIEAQTYETLNNINTLLGSENMKNYGVEIGFNLKDLEAIRVYIKNEEDYKDVKKIIDTIWNDRPVLYVHDHICRPGFLLEIEGLARKNTK